VVEIVGSKKGNEPYRIMVVDLEPTHYKTDLWNVVSDSELTDIFVIYTQVKNWSPDGGHNYLKFPDKNYDNVVHEGRGVFGSLRSAFGVSKKISKYNSDVIVVFGYAHIQMIFALFTSFIFRKRFLLYVDEFNNKWPVGKLGFFKWVARETMRLFSFRYADAVLVCGRKGIESAVKAGCDQNKIYDFPYTVDLERILSDMPEEIPKQCLADMHSSRTVLFFSGRMIERKGLPSLLSALSGDDVGRDWTLWIEGAGPEMESYIALVHEYGIADRCHFLGFCQYDLHSWLIRSSDIVIVPSLEDNWGIVVDEGLQLGKTVVSSDATGSGYDRIIDKTNGYIFPAGNSNVLAHLLSFLINNKDKRKDIENSARYGPKNVRPIDNLNALLKIIQCK